MWFNYGTNGVFASINLNHISGFKIVKNNITILIHGNFQEFTRDIDARGKSKLSNALFDELSDRLLLLSGCSDK